MQKLRNQHYRLEAIMRMIEQCDDRIAEAKKELDKPVWSGDTVIRNFLARTANKYRRIRTRLYVYYSDVFVRMAAAAAKEEKEPCTPSPKHSVQLAEWYA